MRTIWLLLLALTACGVTPQGTTLAETSALDSKMTSGPYGIAWGPSCDFQRPTLDPRWTPSERLSIRAAASQWADATGVDLGGLPAADAHCVPGETQACIALGDETAPRPRAPSTFAGAVLFRDRIALDGYDLGLVALHEIGHYIGIDGHLAEYGEDHYVMRASMPIPDSLTDWDVQVWANFCL